jgi:hypothetical protein
MHAVRQYNINSRNFPIVPDVIKLVVAVNGFRLDPILRRDRFCLICEPLTSATARAFFV